VGKWVSCRCFTTPLVDKWVTGTVPPIFQEEEMKPRKMAEFEKDLQKEEEALATSFST
jgi:hypothetical protein